MRIVKMVIDFTNQRNLDLFAKNCRWFNYEAFNLAPSDYQLYIVHVLVNDFFTIPQVYNVAYDKSYSACSEILRIIRIQKTQVSLEIVIFEFEIAIYLMFLLEILNILQLLYLHHRFGDIFFSISDSVVIKFRYFHRVVSLKISNMLCK